MTHYLEIAGQDITTWDWWVSLTIFGIALLTLTLTYFIVRFVLAFVGKKEAAKKGGKIITKIVTPIVGGLALIGMIGAPVLVTNWSNIYMAITGNAGIGAIDTESSKLAAAEAAENIVTIQKEGTTLLRNENNCLPLNVETNKKVNIFGAGAYGMFYGNGGSGAVQTPLIKIDK